MVLEKRNGKVNERIEEKNQSNTNERKSRSTEENGKNIQRSSPKIEDSDLILSILGHRKEGNIP